MKKIKISAIVAVYNVEEYIEEALDSLVEQEVANIDLEIIVVDDGSTDQTGSILSGYQQKFDNIKVINVNRVGLGKARNIAVEACTGEYIIFMDGDDIIYPQAYLLMLNSALENDADIVVGNVSRFDSNRKFFLSGLHKKIFSDDLEGTNILKNNLLIYDSTAWNKLFKASFFKENELRFLEGMLYEDIPCIMKAHLLSKKTNIILDYVYKWRLRDNSNNKSITQNRHDQQNLLDRVKSVDVFTEVVEELKVDDDNFLRAKEYKELTIDYKLYLDMLPEVDKDYFNLYSDLLKKYIDNMKTNVFDTEISTELKMLYEVVMEKDYEKYLFLITNISEFRNQKTVQKGNKVTKNLTGTKIAHLFDDPIIDMTNDVIPVTKTKSIRWSKGVLHIDGFLYLRYMNSDRKVSMKAHLVNRDESKRHPLLVSVSKDKSITQMFGGGKDQHLIKRFVNYDFSHYDLFIDTNDKKVNQLLEEPCFIKIEMEVCGVKAETFIANPSKGIHSKTPDYLCGNNVYRAAYNKQWRLEISKFQRYAEKLDIHIDDNYLVITGQQIEKFSGGVLECSKEFYTVENEKFEILNDGQFKLFFDINKLTKVDYNSNYYFHLINDNKKYCAWLDENFIPLYLTWKNREIHVIRTYNKFLKINLNETISPKLIDIKSKSIDKENQKISLTVRQDTHEVKMIKDVMLIATRISDGKKIEISPSEIKQEDNYCDSLYTITLSKDDLFLFGNSRWSFEQTIKLDEKVSCNKLVVYDTKKILKLSVQFSVDKNIFRFYTTRDGSVKLATSYEKDFFEKGPRRQKLLTDYLYPMMRLLPQKRKYVMFESYWGKSFSCNPKAIYEEMQRDRPDLACVWSLNNPYTQVTGNAKKVKRNSWKYFYYLARSKYFINNVNWQNQYKKRKKSVEIQTLHGTFLKTMGLDVKNEVDTPKKLEGFRLRHKRWDYLVSPSKFMTEISKRVFEFNGEMLEYGFPRNDALVNVSKEQESIIQIKRELNIPLDKKIILYAPTFRNTRNFNLELDIKQMKEKLSDEYVLLVRLHYFVAQSIDLEDVSDFAINVCDYPDTQDLLLISDVLISDYSSIMFDYANLSKPIILFTYDLEYYRDTLRGMYANLEKEAPGRLCRTTEEVVESLGNIDLYEQENSVRLLEFKLKYNEYETGEASKLIIKKVFDKKS